ncbi:MAG: hypothetical protein JWM11_5306 [Planctomycetaceae bacterium]|nr:hypothetical protein [Planctomycetaceae bacterium]
MCMWSRIQVGIGIGILGMTFTVLNISAGNGTDDGQKAPESLEHKEPIGTVAVSKIPSSKPAGSLLGDVAKLQAENQGLKKTLSNLIEDLNRRRQVHTFVLNDSKQQPPAKNVIDVTKDAWRSELSPSIAVKKGDQLLIHAEFSLFDGDIYWSITTDSSKAKLLADGHKVVNGASRGWSPQSTTALVIAQDDFEGENGIRLGLLFAKGDYAGTGTISKIEMTVQNLGLRSFPSTKQ